MWELYAPDDWTQAHDIAAEDPEKLAHLQRCSCSRRRRYNVFPLDDRRVERFNPDLAGRPTLIRGNSQVLFRGMGRLSENSVLNVKNKSHAVTADLHVPDGGASGVIVAQGGAFGGWSLYLHDGRPAYCYNLFGLQRFTVRGDDAVPAGDHQVRIEFAYDGGGLGKGGTADLYLDGSKVGEGRVDATVPMVLLRRRDPRRRVRHRRPPSATTTTPAGSVFTGRIHRVQIDLGDDAEDDDHLITPEERMRIATARQ